MDEAATCTKSHMYINPDISLQDLFVIYTINFANNDLQKLPEALLILKIDILYNISS